MSAHHQHAPQHTAGSDPVNASAAFNPFTVSDDDLAPAQARVRQAAAVPAPAPAPAAAQAPEPGPEPASGPDDKPTAGLKPADKPTQVAGDNMAGTGQDTAAVVEKEPEEPNGSPEGEPVETEAQRVERERQHAIAAYAARRRRYTLMALAVALVAVWLIKPWSGLSVPNFGGLAAVTGGGDHGPRKTTQSARAARDVVADDMNRIHTRLSRRGDLTGLRLSGADVASAGRSAYVARVLDGQCVVYGVIDGADIVTQADTTGLACAGQIAEVQAQLDAADAHRRAAQVADAERALNAAADTAGFYAQSNYSSGGPSLTGLDASYLDGVTVTVNHGDWARLRTIVDGTCRTAVVAASGHLGEISVC